MARRRIFISYNHSEPDRTLADAIQQAFRAEFDIFIDKDIPIGEQWAHRIDDALYSTDCLSSPLTRTAATRGRVAGEMAKPAGDVK